jgi:MFS family permease
VEAETTADPQTRIYNRDFWMAYASNLLLVTANAINFRFAEFVTSLGGTEGDVGLIAGAALYGSLLVRFWQARALDRIGVARTWRLNAVVFFLISLSVLGVHHLGPAIYAVRILVSISVAGIFACSLSHIQTLAPPSRRIEMIATLGSSGFLGMILGTQAVDLIFLLLRGSPALFPTMFGVVAFLGLVHLVLVARLTDGHVHIIPDHTPPAWVLLRLHWPGLVIAAAFVMGASFSVMHVFLTRFASERQLGGIRVFFTVYAATAFVMRLASRNWHRVTGPHWMVVFGLSGHALCQLLLVNVEREWQFVLPAVCGGFGHALLYPCIVSLSSGVFPPQYRGTGVTMTLMFVDLGTAVLSPVFGVIIDRYGFATMFRTAAAVTALTAISYALATRGSHSPEIAEDD